MDALSKFELDILAAMLAGDDEVLTRLRDQATETTVREREATGVGFFASLDVPRSCPATLPVDFEISDVHGRVEGLAHGVAFVLYVRDGYLSMLEGATFDEPWLAPFAPQAYELSYDEEPRPLFGHEDRQKFDTADQSKDV